MKHIGVVIQDAEFQKTGIVYARVSSQEQVSGTSLAMQERYCREYAARENIKLLACFVEEGESAKTVNRTEFQKALSFCADKKQPVDYFIVHKIDRFARNQEDHVFTQAILRKYGTKLRSVSEQIDESPVGKMMEGVLATFAEFDNNVRAARSKGGMVEKVRRGVWVWIAPMGYKRLSKGGNLVIDDDMAPYVRMAFEEYAKGTHSFESLATHLYSRGLRTKAGKKLNKQSVEKMVRNPIYYGTIRAFGEENQASFAPLIEETLFWRCQPGTKNKFRSGSRGKNNPEFPLRKFVICEDCGTALTGSSSTGRSGVKYPYYHHQKQGCVSATSISKADLEARFVRFLEKISPKPDYEKIFTAIVRDVWQENYKKLDGENARVRKEIEVLEEERQRIFNLHRAETYTDEEFMDQKDLINLEIQQKKILLEDKRIEEFDMDEALSYCFGLVRESAKTWTDLAEQPLFRIRFQNQIFPEKTTIRDGEFGTSKLSLIYETNQHSHADLSQLVIPRGIEPRFGP